MSARLFCVWCLLLVPLGWLGCKDSGGTAGGGASGNEIVIGHYAAMSGAQATFGQSTDNGIRLAIEEINAAGGVNGKQLRLITYDDKGDTKEAGAAVTRLITRDKVVAVLGQVASSLSLAGAPVCQEHGVPMITPSSTNPQVTQVGDKIFRVCFIDPFQGYVTAKYIRELPTPVSRVAILHDQANAYSVGLAQEFEKAFTRLGGTITTRQTYSEGDQDFSAQLTAIRGSNPEMVFIPGYYSDVGNIALQARKLGVTVPLFGGDGWTSPRLTEIAGSALEGCFFSEHYSQEDPNPKIQNFVQKYAAKYGSKPDGLAALGYDAARLLADAMTRARSLSGDDLAAAIAATRDFDGVTGTFSIDADRNAVKPAVILKIVNGQVRYEATVTPESP
jgi:branched-chain amino acid transport system substrate-binding protein